MNPRIQALADEATSIVEMVGPQGYASSYANFDREKFAQLIVTECVRVCVADLADPRDSVELRCAKKIQKHFEAES